MSGKSWWGDLVRRFSRRRLVAGALLAMPACGDECLRDKGVAEGTRFEVTVTEDAPGCYTTFTAGEVFYVVAGKPYETEECPVSTGTGTPEFASTELEFLECRSRGSLGVECDVTFPGCANEGSRLETRITEYPAKRGETVNAKFGMHLYSACGGGCDPLIPVTIKWL